MARHLKFDLRASIRPGQERALRNKIALLLRAYSSGRFEDYLRFRDSAEIVPDGDARVRERIKLLESVWDSEKMGPVPTTAVGLLAGMWKLHVVAPVLDSINWATLRVEVREIREDALVPAEWDEWAGLESHFYKEFVASRRASLGACAHHLMLPNRTSVATIARHDGKVLFADCEFVFQTKPFPALPLRFRLVWHDDNDRPSWLPLHAMTLDCSGPPFIW